jgi:uncharacterized protein (DUF2236 family)
VDKIASYPEETEGFFRRDSQIWRVHRELVLLLAGGRALLMQLAHPKIAAGVAEHSRFQNDPLTRLHRTMSTMWSIVFDPRAQAEAALESLERRHTQVRGVVGENEPAQGGESYDALDQDLLLWVHATLIDSALVAYTRFVEPLAGFEKIVYYEDVRRFAALFGIRPEIIPTSLEAFDAYVKRMLHGGEIAVGPTAKNLARDVLYPRPWIFKPGGPFFRLVTAGILPENLRSAYDLRWSARREKMLDVLAISIRNLLPFVPAQLRIAPNARAAERVGRH